MFVSVERESPPGRLHKVCKLRPRPLSISVVTVAQTPLLKIGGAGIVSFKKSQKVPVTLSDLCAPVAFRRQCHGMLEARHSAGRAEQFARHLLGENEKVPEVAAYHFCEDRAGSFRISLEHLCPPLISSR